MSRSSGPIVAILVTVVSTLVTIFLGDAALKFYLAQDRALAAQAFGAPAVAVDDPFGAVPAVVGNTNAFREAIVSTVSTHFWGACLLVSVLCLVWIAWFSIVKINGPHESRKGRPTWLILLVVLLFGTAGIAFSIFMSPADENLSAEGRYVVFAAVMGFPLLCFLLTTRIITPNAARLSLLF